ncbi:MAG: Tn3 family transposase [Blastocatellia bacterium]|nr:Tn3 family transposase [Blastocatellia bacterium]
MPVQWLTEADRDRYRRFPPEILEADVITFFILSEGDRNLVNERVGDDNRLGFALQLCALRFLGFLPDKLTDAPASAVAYLARQLAVSPESLTDYGRRSRTRTDHGMEVGQYLGFGRFSNLERQDTEAWLSDRALEHDRPATLLRLICERLHARKIVRPGITHLERMVSSARQDAERRTWHCAGKLLTQALRREFDQLLIVQPGQRVTRLTWLRTGAVSPSPAEILRALEKIKLLRDYGVPNWDVRDFNPNRLKSLARIGRTATNQMLQRMPNQRRYPVLLAFLHQILMETIDEALDLFDQCLHDVSARAKRELDELRKSVARATNEKVKHFQTVGLIVLDPKVTDADVRHTIYQAIPKPEFQAAVTECAIIERPLDDSHFDLIDLRYSYLRQFTPRFLDAFTWQNALESEALVGALEVLHTMWANGDRMLPEDAPTGFIPKNWKPFVFDGSHQIKRRSYELCALWTLRDALRSGNVWVAGSRRYANPAGFLIPPERWETDRAEACRILKAPAEATARLHTRTQELHAAALHLDQLLTGTGSVSLDEDDCLVLSPLEAVDRPPTAISLERMVSERLPLVDLPALLIEVDGWIQFSRDLTHANSHLACSTEALPTLYASLLAQSGNFGLARMAHMSDLPEHRLLWTTNWYIREETLRLANNRAVNFHHRLPLSRHWGGGTLSSSDGQRFPVTVKTTTATPLPRYFGFGRGITFYTWTSDQYAQYGTKVIPSTLRDATVVLDEILDNETDLGITEHATDTAGFTEAIFGLFDLLGLQFSPRLRDVGRQQLYRLGEVPGKLVRTLLKKTINRTLIETHWDDLLRLAGSLKLGWCTASLLLSKLNAAPNPNSLIEALQEYGRLVKSLFIRKFAENWLGVT